MPNDRMTGVCKIWKDSMTRASGRRGGSMHRGDSHFPLLFPRFLPCQLSPAELLLNWDSRSSEKMAAKFMKRDTFIQMVIFKQIFHFCIFRQNFNCHTSPTSMPNFCIGFWNDIGDKKSEKSHFRVLPISRENYPCRPVFEGLELNQKSSPPFWNK